MKRVNKSINLKLTIILIAFIFVFSIIAARFYIIQVSQVNFFKEIAEKQYSTEVTIMPPRANIYDRNDKPLAINKETTSAFILPQEMVEKERTLSFLKKHFKKTYQSLKKNPQRKFLWLERNINKELRALVNKSKIKDIHYLKESSRYYPHKELSQVLGSTDIDNNGISGLELHFNKKLSGMPSTLKIEKDARNNRLFFTNKLVSEGHKGSDIKTTIDSNLQFLAGQEIEKTVEKFNAKAGSAIIIDPQNGHVLSMVNYPYHEEKNVTVSDCYEFGSVIKTFLALAALEEKVTTTDELIDCEGKVTYIDKFRVENWKHLEVLPFSDVIKYSSNVGTAKIAKRLEHKQYDHLDRLGFGKHTDIEFPGDRSGFLSHPNNWSRSTPFVLSFGYEMNATLLQLAKAFSIISNDGCDVNPRIIMSNDINIPNKRLYRQESIDLLKDILDKKYNFNGYRIMGKTGTARMIEDGKYTNKRHVYTYGGIVEHDNYKRVIVTFIREPEKTYLWASQVTAPLFKNIAEKMVLYESMNLDI